jgi:hypothetical protein
MDVHLLHLLFGVGKGLCDELITCSAESYRVCISVCDLETSTMTQPRPQVGLLHHRQTDRGTDRQTDNGCLACYLTTLSTAKVNTASVTDQ